MLAPTGRAADPGEAAQEPSALEERLDRGTHDRAKRPEARLEALVVGPEVAVEVALEELVESGALRMTGSIDPQARSATRCWRCGHGPGTGQRRAGRAGRSQLGTTGPFVREASSSCPDA